MEQNIKKYPSVPRELRYLCFLILIIQGVSMLPIIFSFGEVSHLAGGKIWALAFLILYAISMISLLALIGNRGAGWFGFLAVQALLALLEVRTGVHMDQFNGLIYIGVTMGIVYYLGRKHFLIHRDEEPHNDTNLHKEEEI